MPISYCKAICPAPTGKGLGIMHLLGAPDPSSGRQDVHASRSPAKAMAKLLVGFHTEKPIGV